MATYAIGDIHGCFDELQALLKQISFDTSKDVLWFTGDLVNGGNKSIATMQFIKNLGSSAICVLGNHDLALLALTIGKAKSENLMSRDLNAILISPKKEELLAWLRSLPLIHYAASINTLLVHAGLAPQWDTTKAINLAKEVEAVIHGPLALQFFSTMFGNEPAMWNDNLTGFDRLRCITSYLTRLRFCSQNGHMNFSEKGPVHKAPPNMLPWYEVPNRLSRDTKIIFGHWAALLGQTGNHNVIALDTGCVWGRYLSAMRLEDNQLFKVNRISK